jgi:putative SOS response-associated peptidase YedK
MGDRYTLTVDKATLAARYALEIPERYTPRYNAAPTQILPVITQGSSGCSFFYWGQIPEWSNNKSISGKLIHADSAQFRQKPAGRQALSLRRCLIPADGYYEWKQVSKKGKIPYRVIWRDGKVFSMGGIWEEFEDEEGHTVHTFRILTTQSIPSLSDLNNRMPLIIPKQAEHDWLTPENSLDDLENVMVPFDSDEFHMYTVSPRVSDASYDHPSLVKPFSPADQFGNYSLFD